MGKRGRKSMNELMVSAGNIKVAQRPAAPSELTQQEAAEWREITSAMPADHFARSNYPLLKQLCRHVVASRRVAQLAESAAAKPDFDLRQFAALLQMQATESAAILRLSRSMRLTQQAVKRADVVGSRPIKSTPMPWEDETDDLRMS